MCERIISFIVYVAIATSLWPTYILCEYDNQPKIHLKSGGLILEAAYDRNITFRLSRDSSLFLNKVNLMDKIRQRYTPAIPDIDAKLTDTYSTDDLKSEIQKLHDDLERFAHRVMTSQNHTRRTLQLGVIRRNLGRINRLNGRLLALERKLKKDECAEATEPCKNGGTCYDSYNGFHCECTEGYTGKTCEKDVDECYLFAGTDLGCQNNGICINTPGSYKCNCAKEFSGSHCRLRNVVCHQEQSRELCSHGTCVPANNQQGYTCICEQGWIRNTTSLSCDVDVNECEGLSNPCHSQCINLPGSFKCGPCPAGYTGNGITCLDINECSTNNGGCSLLPKVRCINTEGSYFCASCPPGWVGDGHTCELAPSNSCNDEKICHPQAKCEYISDVASCTCPPGMFGHGFGPRGCHSNPLTDSCESHICQNNGTCISNGRTTSCLCPKGYSGALCETADGCHPNPCQNDGTCKPLGVNGFKCSCLPGTTGKHCELMRSICAKTMRLPSGELKYPTGEETEYSNNERCAWIIRTTPTHILNVTFTKFDVEGNDDCTHDWLQIHDGNSLASQLIGRFCGNDLPLGGNILSSHHLLFFWFRSDNATNRPGFEMSWVSQPHVCGENLELASNGAGVIRSPGYPGKTPINRECQWELSAPYGYRFALRIYDVNLGTLPNCTGDSLKITDADLLIKQYCQSSKSEVLRSSSNKILLHFHTDRFSADSSFQLHYEVEPGIPHCGGIFSEPLGYIIGPSEQATCLYLIQQPVGTQIKWEFLDLKSFEMINCNINRIEIFDGKTDEDDNLLVTCGGILTEPVVSSSNHMLIRYKNSLDVNNPFRAKYSRVCEFRVFGPDAGVLNTPNYPNPYVEHITCTFHIYGPGDTVVLANFTDFAIEETKTNNLMDTADNIVANNSITEVSKLKDDSISYVDVYLSSTNKRRYHKGSPMVLRSERNVMTIIFHATTNNAKARGLRIEYSFETITCGGVFTENKGSIDKTVNGDECLLIFEAPEGKHIKLDMEYAVYGDSGELLIYANETAGGDMLLKNVTRSSRIRETFNFNTVTLIMKQRMRISGSYEFVTTKEACGGNFTTLYGAVVSPSWPRPYHANLDCVWVITAPLGNKIELQVHNFTLEPTCSGDILEIRNGKFSTSPLIGRYCASQMPSRIASFTNSLYIRFTSDNYIEGGGFYLNWEQTSTGCGGKLTAYKGSIHPPHFDATPEVMTMGNVHMICDWQIVVSQGSSIDLSVKTSTDMLEFCRKNNLRIYDGDSTLSPLIQFNCTNILRGQTMELKSSTNQLLIIYSLTQNSKYETPEFILDYVTNCKVVIDNYRGVIESPNFPENYPENQKCAWDLKAGRNNKFKLVFSHLDMEVTDMTCEYDYVEIWDMKDLDILKKYHLCSYTSEPITSEGNHMMVHFVSDYSNNKNGFRLEYTRVGCGEHLEKEFGYITSPNYPYSNDLDCDWYIEAPPGRQIFLNVVEFHIESDNPDCSQNILLFKESKNSSIELGKECSEQHTALSITSPANRLYVHFRTSATRSRKYFKAFYHTRAASCGGSFKGISGTISSSNYPYSPNAQSYHCIWDITVPESYGILLDFKDFQLSDSQNCTEASMEFWKLSGTSVLYLDKFCGAEKPNIKIVHGNHLKVEYKDRGKQSLGRFAIEYKKQCGGLLTESTGYIKSTATEECIWEFDVKQGTLISLNIIQLNCYCRKDNEGVKTCKNGLGIKENHFDNNLQSGNYTMFMCEEHQADLVFEASKLHIFANNINFRAKYSTTQHSCGGHIESERGSLASPYFPLTYPPNIECIWSLQGSKGSFLELQFDQFDIASSEHCNEDYLEIRTWSESKILGLYCGSGKPEKTLISFERFWLKFHSADGSTGKGFKLSWNYAHLNDLINKTRGYISNPPVKMVQNDEEPYAWRILVPRGEFIQLYFQEYNKGLNLYDGFDETALLIDIPLSPWRFVSSSNVVYLRTDNDNFETFSILWNTTTNKPIDTNATLDKCHSEQSIKVHRFNAIRVVSPGYPKGYEHGLRCDWIFKPFNPIEHVAVALIDVDLETTGDCSADYLKISTSVDLVSWHKNEQLCNGSSVSKMSHGTPFKWVHGTPHIKLDFVTDMSINRTGFLAKVVAKCGSNMTDSVGFIGGNMLHDFNDGPNTQCLWHVNVKPGKRIRVQIDYPKVALNKEDFDEECNTHVLLYDGVDDHAPLIPPGKLCYPQNVTTIHVNTSSNHLTIKYTLNMDKVSPKLTRALFWNLTYREYSECSQEIRLIPEASEINITSPLYPNVPHPHTECEWRVVAPQGEIIQIEFLERFDMNSRYCSQEYLELFDGSTSLSRNIGRYCRKPPNLRTTQNMLYIHYLTDIAEPRNGFKARISISRCGGTYSENYGTIKSPGYPASYPSSSQCDFVINLTGKNLIRIKLIDINLPYNETKLSSSDHLEIISIGGPDTNSQSIMVYGNTTNSTEFLINSNKVVVRFHTFLKTFAFRGFSLIYNSDGSYCANVVTGVSGEIIMNLPAKQYYQNTCTWKITVPKKQRVRLDFLNMEAMKDQNFSSSLRISLNNNFDYSSEIITFTPSTFNSSMVLQSTDNIMYVRVIIPRSNSILRPLKARYSSKEESPCPSDIDEDNNSGSIDIPGLETIFRGNFYCGIKIKLNEGETIAFNISTLLVSGYRGMGRLQYPLVFRDSYMNTQYRNNLTEYIHAQSQTKGSISIAQDADNRIQRLKMSFRIYPCGGVINVNPGLEIKTPQVNTNNSDGQIVCVWTLLKPYLAYGQDKNKEFKLNGTFKFTDSCENEYVEIVEGQWMNRTSAMKICRDHSIENFEYLISKRTTFLIYRSTNYKSEKLTFSLNIEKIFTCSSETMVNMISSPIKIDKTLYKNNEECSWIFYTKPGLYLQVQFIGRFFIENSPNCTNDYLEIQRDSDGLWIPEARFCGREVPAIYNSSASRLQIIFRTNENVTTEGFEFVVQTHCQLQLNVSSSQPQFIVSPPNNVQSWRKLHCEYIFKGNETDKLIVVRAKFDPKHDLVYTQDRCRLGALTVNKQDDNGVDLVGTQHCQIEFEERAYKYLRFVYDAYVGQRFTLEYAYDTCGGNLTAPAVIRPLKHETESTYANNMNCIWYITAPPEHSIAVRFKYFSTEETYDHLTIYSGIQIKKEKLIAKLSGNYSANIPIVVESNQAVINAISDSSGSRKGFEANIVFIANCNERISLTEGNSPVTLARNIKFNSSEEYICNYRITAPKDYRIRVEIKKLQINGANSTCQNSQSKCENNCNYLEIFDNPTTYDATFGKFCSVSSINRTFLSSYEFASLKLNADRPGQYNFEIILKMEKSECGLTEYRLGDNEKYKFTFPPNGLAKYAANVHCTWRLISSHELEFHFNYMDLQNKSQVTNKCLDYVNIKGTYHLHNLCGLAKNFTINTIKSHEDFVDITFHSDDSEEGKGFEFVVQRSDACNRTYNSLSKSIQYRGYGKEKEICIDTIIVPENYTLNFYITSMYFKNYDCEKLHLKIIDLKTNETLMDRCRSSYLNVNLFTNTNAVRIEAADYTSVAFLYSVSDRNLTPGCGGTFTANEAQFASPPYDNDRNFSECRWDIITPASGQKSLQFYDFNMGTITNCHLDNVKIIEILPNGTEKLLKTVCGSNTPDAIRSNSSHLAIISKKSPNFDGTGWTLSYTTFNYETPKTALVVSDHQMRLV
ncbi:cubilin homolog [Lucilia sericata]|uniref:cubilin homolog n=1 Tax=Lucilia sericata TaxID=13632 RepID=UPI0018A86C01|nr:cubilin homolog [Lucilia sericata]